MNFVSHIIRIYKHFFKALALQICVSTLRQGQYIYSALFSCCQPAAIVRTETKHNFPEPWRQRRGVSCCLHWLCGIVVLAEEVAWAAKSDLYIPFESEVFLTSIHPSINLIWNWPMHFKNAVFLTRERSFEIQCSPRLLFSAVVVLNLFRWRSSTSLLLCLMGV